jgi:hypothetical protein
LFCGYSGSSETTETAHIYEKEDIDKSSSKADDKTSSAKNTAVARLNKMIEYGFSDWNDSRNLLCLCKRCHNGYDKSKTISIDPTTVELIISPSIFKNQLLSENGTYGSLNKKKLNFPDGAACRPPLALLKYRYEILCES